ncbi:MAG TPA: TolC family protein [Bacteroidales bacterium]|nr:TolC family protein [Bacteroidales bacterium]HRZ76006.1 TolC family protein [Bacteroidales bacterium]
MRTLSIIIIIVLLPGIACGAGGLDEVLTQVERNNTTLAAYRKVLEAEILRNHTGNQPPDPEVEFSYLWGKPSFMGDRKDLSLVQRFDFPSAYAYRGRIADLLDRQAVMDYQEKRSEVLQQARLICVELSFRNTLVREHQTRAEHARLIAESYEKKFQAGEAGVLEYNKARISLLSATQALEHTSIERTALLGELARLNGGIPLAFSDSLFPLSPIAADFEQWYAGVSARNPKLQWMEEQLRLAAANERLEQALAFPKLQAGYARERVGVEQFSGLIVGLSIPLWEKRNTVKHARALTEASQDMQHDANLQFYQEMKLNHTRALLLQQSIGRMRSGLQEYLNEPLLLKALEQGEISLTTYLQELAYFYNSRNELLQMEKELHLVMAAMEKY